MYPILVGISFYRRLTPSALWRAIIDGARTTANIFFLLATVGLLAKVLILAQIPQAVAMWVVHMGLGPMGFLMMAVFVLLVLGTFLEAVPLILVTVPIFMGTMNSLGISPILYGAILALMIGVGQITPPVGVVLFVACGVGKAPVGPVLREVWPFLGCQIAVTALTVLFPPIATYLPSLTGG